MTQIWYNGDTTLEEYEDGYAEIGQSSLYIGGGSIYDEIPIVIVHLRRVCPDNLLQAMSYLESVRNCASVKPLANELGIAVNDEKCHCGQYAQRRNNGVWECFEHRTDTRWYNVSLTFYGDHPTYIDSGKFLLYHGVEYPTLDDAMSSIQYSSNKAAIIRQDGTAQTIEYLYFYGKLYTEIQS